MADAACRQDSMLVCRVAVEREDYDMAKALKQDIDKLRAAGEAAATGHIAEVPKSRRATDPEEIFNRVLGRSAGLLPFASSASLSMLVACSALPYVFDACMSAYHGSFLASCSPKCRFWMHGSLPHHERF